MSEITVFTTGYEGSDPETFVWHLQKNGVRRVIDVRNNPVSRNRNFSQNKLREFLEAAGLEYFHMRELGAPAEIRHKLRDDGDMTEYFHAYRGHLEEHPESLEELLDHLRQTTCVLLCLERDPNQCHRSVLADQLRVRAGGELRVEHI